MNTKKGLKLFTPVNLGSLNLKHRVVMAPLTRSRSEQPGGIPGDLMVRYYSDRASDGGSQPHGNVGAAAPRDLDGDRDDLLGHAGLDAHDLTLLLTVEVADRDPAHPIGDRLAAESSEDD